MRKFFKIVVWVCAAVLILLLLTIIALQFPFVQNFVAKNAIDRVADRLDTNISVESVRIRIPNSVRISGLYIEDQRQDTLWYSETIFVELEMFGLLRNSVSVKNVVLENVVANVNRAETDDHFNYDFIPQAFAGNTETPEPVDNQNKDSHKPPDISVGTITLANIRAHYNDEVDGDKVKLDLGRLSLEFDEIDVDKLVIQLAQLELEDVSASVTQSKEKEPEEKEPREPAIFTVGAGRIGLSTIDVKYENKINDDFIALDLSSFRLNNVNYISADNRARVSSVHVDNTDFVFQTGPKEDAVGQNGIDFTDLHITDFNLDLEDIWYAGETGGVKINAVSFRDKSGFSLEEFSADVLLDEQQASINELIVQTGYSNINLSLSAEYPSLEIARDDPGQVRFDFSLRQSFLAFHDALYFQPSLAEDITIDGNEGLTVAASVNGRVDDLTIGMLEGNVLGSTHLKSYGRITGLPEIEKAVFDMTIERITTGRDDIIAIVRADMLPENITIPSSIELSGTFEGTTEVFATFIDLHTSFGQMVASMDMDIRNDQEKYSGSVTISDFDVGQLLDQSDQLGTVSMSASIDGSGFDDESIDAYLDATVDHFQLMGYDYNDISIDGRFQNRQFTGFAGMDDPNLTFRFNGDVQLTEEEPVFSFNFELENADLYALQLYDTTMTIQGSISADFVGASIETINGELHVRDLRVVHAEQHYPIDSLLVRAAAQPGDNRISVESDIFTASYEGTVNIAGLGDLIVNHFNLYFELHHLEGEDEYTEDEFTFRIDIIRPEILFDIVLPGLHDLSPASVTGSYTGANRNLDIKIDVPAITYESYVIDSLQVSIESDRESISYDLRTASFEMPSMKFISPEIYGSIQNNIVQSNIRLYDEQYEKFFELGSSFESMDTVYVFSLTPGEFVLNYDEWQIPEENYVRFGDGVLYVHNIQLERAGSRILAQSTDDGTAAPPVEIVISEFDISVLPQMIGMTATQNGDESSIDIAGILNGSTVLKDVLSEMKVAIDLTLTDFIFNQSEVGDIALRVQQDEPDRYDLAVDITQHENRAHIDGFIRTGEEDSDIDISVNIESINLASVEGFTLGALTEMDGSLIGDLRITGSTNEPDINGSFTLQDASFLVTQLNSRLNLENETIVFSRDGILFDSITITDSEGNNAFISGNIFTTDFTDYRFAIDIRSSNFMLMNTSRQHNDMFYGRIIIDSNIRVSGDQLQPVVNATIGFKEGTNLTVIVPEQDPEVIERAGIVEFVQMDENHEPIRDADSQPDTIRTGLQGIDLTANIDVDLQTSFTVMIDEQAGDVVQVRGGGTMSFGIDPSGLISIAGRYEITQGSYQMTFYEIARRRFEIRPGSNITWAGDPMDANVDLTAIYTVRASSVDLVADQVGDEARQQYRRALPFHVLLHMRGNLLTPDISFELDMPEEQRGAFGGVVYQQVQRINEDETERNKQVFALLVLNRFLPENPFELGEGAGLTGTARTSASKLLTQQLNALSGRYIRGMDIQFDVESYEEFTEEGPAGRTELQLQVSRRFLEDRLIVELGGQFDIEGERARDTELSDIAGDLAVEYLLTDDGRYRLRGFRKTEFNTLGEGDIIFTGLSLVYAREFNRFMDLFRRPPDVESTVENEIIGGEEND